ncbi:beta-propeller domain-containing protein [Nocardioides sp. MH1]|uniref:beta-propeller domain-containing protein n=1 Tax=Nocardioides sp. MH1 TaxID=3242490 RepID=UPI003521BC01
MTDLEELWDDLPVGKAPTHDILRAGRKAAGAASGSGRRRRFLVRPLLTAGVVTGVVGAFIAGALVNGGSGGGGSDDSADSAPFAESTNVAFQADLEPAESCDELLEAYVDRGLGRVTAWGWEDPYRGYYGRDLLVSAKSMTTELHGNLNGLADDGYVPQASAPWADTGALSYNARSTDDDAPHTVRQQDSDTGTNVQEIGVDEPDVVKTDGSLLARVRDDELVVYDVTGPHTERLSSLRLDGIEGTEIMLTGDTVVAVGTDDEAPRTSSTYGESARVGTRVLTVSLTDPRRPEVVDDVAYDARLLSARQHGADVRLVLSSGLPDLGFAHPHRGLNRREALDRNRQRIKRSTIEDWLPTIAADGGDPDQLLDCTDVAVPDDELTLDTVSIVGFDAGDATSVDAIGLAGATDIAYESTDHLYLAATPAWGDGIGCWEECPYTRSVPSVRGGSTYLFDFALDGTRATHVASGEVEGAIDDRWAMDEADDVLRVAVTPTSETGDFNSVVTLEQDGQDLVEVGRLDGLGRHEDLTSVRWSDGLAVLVTYRQVDPLLAVDLTDVKRPRLIAKLKIPGFSSYLHPLGPKRLVGIGQGPTGHGWGAQAGLFNVAHLERVHRMDVLHYANGTDPLAGTDPRSFTFINSARTFLTVIQDYRRTRVGYLSVVHIEDGRLHNRMVQVEYGDDVDQVRAVPLPDGRVVLVTGEDVEFFDLHDRS